MIESTYEVVYKIVKRRAIEQLRTGIRPDFTEEELRQIREIVQKTDPAELDRLQDEDKEFQAALRGINI